MRKIMYYSTNNYQEKVDFETALLNGMGSNYGLYMFSKEDIPHLSMEKIKSMRGMSYAEIAYEVLSPFLLSEIPKPDLRKLLNNAYDEEKIRTRVEHVTGRTYIMWLTDGPTYSFKDYAARFYGRVLEFFLKRRKERRIVIVATSGDTGGAIADALYGLESVDLCVFYPKDSISEEQRRQMTTLQGNVYAFEVNGDFDICQALAKEILSDKEFAKEVFKQASIFTSANSISIGRLLPQAVYPFYGYSRIEDGGLGFIASVPSGNFGNMMGTVIAKAMGLPVRKIICALNENAEFMEFLKEGRYVVKPTVKSPSSAMNVSHPNNIARLFDFYGGHIYDERDVEKNEVVRRGIIDRMPDMEKLRRDIEAISVSNEEHYKTIRDVYYQFGVLLDPHGAVGWNALEKYLKGVHDFPSIVYETAHPGKFPKEVERAVGFKPEIPFGITKRMEMEERIYKVESEPERTESGLRLTKRQVEEAKSKIREILAP
ncbi:MAG: threonine synthase [Desulfobacterota bacterium]|nr:threonine synthase [Thermodesulfobacteriota bacterium]MDW8001680.1 threonine synthase [Deltaproteobacteria bacterium]